MSQWQAADARQRFGELIDAAIAHGPQAVMRQKETVAVVLSAAEFDRLRQQADANFAALLAQSPFGPDDNDAVGMSLASGG